MNHWQMITLAYGLTFAALALEVVLLFRRRRHAVRQALDGVDALDGLAPPAEAIGAAAGPAAASTAGLAAADPPAGSGSAAGARTTAGAAR